VPVRAGRGRAREHLPSYREPASRSSRTGDASTFDRGHSPRTLSPSLRSCSASGGASSFLRASALRTTPPRGLATPRWARRVMRPTDFCHPCETACTRTSWAPGSLRGFHREDATPSRGSRNCFRGFFGANRSRGLHGVLGSVRLTRGTGASRHPRPLRWIATWTNTAVPLFPTRMPRDEIGAWAFSSHGAHGDRTSDTSVASPCSSVGTSDCFRIRSSVGMSERSRARSSPRCRSAFALLCEPFRASPLA
jgi:hypothetical protein